MLRDIAAAPPLQGSGALRARFRAEALALAGAEDFLQAAFTFNVVPLDAPADSDVLRAGGEAFDAPWMRPESGELTALGFIACTIGPGLEERVRGLFAERRASLALALDSLGTELLLAVSRRSQDALMADVKRRGLTMAGELRPGDPGLALETQSAVLRLAGAEAIGVSLTRLNMLTPVKSGSGMFGVGVNLPAAKWSRCDHCPSKAVCKVARQREAMAAGA